MMSFCIKENIPKNALNNTIIYCITNAVYASNIIYNGIKIIADGFKPLAEIPFIIGAYMPPPYFAPNIYAKIVSSI